MKSFYFFLVTSLVILTFGCEDILSDREKEYYDIGWINYYSDTLSSIPEVIPLGAEINTEVKIVWNHGCKFRSFFDVERKSDYEYLFTIRDVSKSGGCTLDLRAAKTTFNFKPTKKGEYTLHFLDMYGTVTKKLFVN